MSDNQQDWMYKTLFKCHMPTHKQAHIQLFWELSATAISARLATVDWSWPKEWD